MDKKNKLLILAGSLLALLPVGFVVGKGIVNRKAAKASEGEAPVDAESETPAADETVPEEVEEEIKEEAAPEEDVPVVYMTKNITPEGVMAAYKALNWEPTGRTGVKLSTGEPPASNYLEPALIGDVVKHVNGTIVECNTAYSGSRDHTEDHYKVAEEHGFTAIADVKILDENGSMALPVPNGKHLAENYVGVDFPNYDSYLILSHFKGHEVAGFGGAIKNISIGFGSSMGKCWIHSAGTSKTDPWGGEQDPFLESMGEAAKSVADVMGDRIAYVNVMNRISIDCDCNGHPAEPEIADIGVLSSTDPVALDQACIDLVYAAEGNHSLLERIKAKNGLLTLEYSEQIGLGSRKYKLVDLDA